MKRKVMLQRVLDIALKKTITKYFGEKSYIKIQNLTYVKSKDSYMVNVKLFMDDITNSIELYPDALELVVKQGWDVVGDKKLLIISSSLDTI